MTPHQQAILDILQEECAEVIQIVSKIRRFGIDTQMLKQDDTNRSALTSEIGDVLAMIELAIQNDIVTQESVDQAKIKKFEKLRQWSDIFKKMKIVFECGCRRCSEKRYNENINDGQCGLDSFLTSGLNRMVVCPTCGNKRCPHATDHNYACTNSNEPGQEGSDYK